MLLEPGAQSSKMPTTQAIVAEERKVFRKEVLDYLRENLRFEIKGSGDSGRWDRSGRMHDLVVLLEDEEITTVRLPRNGK